MSGPNVQPAVEVEPGSKDENASIPRVQIQMTAGTPWRFLRPAMSKNVPCMVLGQIGLPAQRVVGEAQGKR